MSLIEFLKRRRPKTVTGVVQVLAAAVSRMAELLTGGVLVVSERERNGNREIYAQTLLQLDGDILTMFCKDAVADPEFEELSGQHYDTVAAALAPLASFSTWLTRAAQSCVGVGLAVLGLTGYWSYEPDKLNILRFFSGTLLALALTLVGLFARKSSMHVIGWWARRLTGRARIESEAVAREKLSQTR